ncbi:Krr1-domain-containing protein [Xylariomycetidae sp. FL2044]|nr:Krr1-domain-containing protein [Xylariomycetidae sp. FL2044]
MASSQKRKPGLFDDSEDESDGGVKLQINDEYAKRFEHNKKREELHRLEEKYKSRQTNGHDQDDDDDGGSSSDETEDENGFLATEELDAQISATLQAIKNKDPRVYDGETTFYKPVQEDVNSADEPKEKKEKPVYLQDYHREKILRGDTGADADDEAPPRTYAQEQGDLQQSIRDEIQKQLGADDNGDDSDDDGFVKTKAEPNTASENGIHPSRLAKVKAPKLNLEDADKDPELFLSNFMASRAWVQEDEKNGWQAFESDEGEDEKADEWEAAFNLRFEDPNKSNEILKTYARDVVASRSVRKEDKTGRKRRRELEQEKKEEEKRQRKEERARLRRLKVDEAEDKLKKIKKAAGLSGKTLKDEDWQRLLDGAWENDQWEQEMQKTFNDQYYEEGDDDSGSDDDSGEGSKKTKKLKKPKWDDDIDIKDLIPDFEDDEQARITLTEDEEEQEEEEDDDEGAPVAKRRKTTKDRKKERLASQKEARQERAKLETLVDARMELEDPDILASSSKKNSGPRFAYRDTKAESFGLTTRDILMATDADLNTFAGLKKLAHFRPQDKQSKDKKRLGKKARLRQWRKETFGPEFERDPPAFNPGGEGPLLAAEEKGVEAEDSNIIEGGSSKKKRKRSRGKKGKAVVE